MKKVFWFWVFIISSGSLSAQYSIPGASQQPGWVFPIWIENGDGQRDTVYIGYDSTATWQGWLPQDSIFGAKSIIIDSSKFNVSFRYYMYGDTALKVIVCSLNFNNLFPESSVGAVSFIHAVYPLKFSWDVSLLQSDSLPFISQPQAPHAQAEMYFEMGTYGGAYTNDSLLCSTSNTLLITDTTQPTFNYCTTKDSVRFQDIFNTPGADPGYIIIAIKTWMGHALELPEDPIQSDMEIFPNPSTDYFHIKLPDIMGQMETVLRVYNSVGQLIYLQKHTPDIHNTITFSSPLQPGVYFILLENPKGYLSRRLLFSKF